MCRTRELDRQEPLQLQRVLHIRGQLHDRVKIPNKPLTLCMLRTVFVTISPVGQIRYWHAPCWVACTGPRLDHATEAWNGASANTCAHQIYLCVCTHMKETSVCSNDDSCSSEPATSDLDVKKLGLRDEQIISFLLYIYKNRAFTRTLTNIHTMET